MFTYFFYIIIINRHVLFHANSNFETKLLSGILYCLYCIYLPLYLSVSTSSHITQHTVYTHMHAEHLVARSVNYLCSIIMIRPRN